MTDSEAVDKANELRNKAQELLGQAEVLEMEAGLDISTSNFDSEVGDLISRLNDTILSGEMIMMVKELCYRGQEQRLGVPMCPECKIPLENDNVDMMQWFCPNGYACKHVKKREREEGR